MGEHATREAEIDDLLRGEVLVDLFRVTKQALRASVVEYSIKDVEKLFGFERTADVGGGGESVTEFETWLEIGEQSLLDGIRDYNQEDCVSLYELHRWLLGRRPADMPWRLPPDERERSEEARSGDAERERVRDELLAGAEEGEPDWLLAHLLDYHQREERPQWWEYFFHRGLDDEELVSNTEHARRARARRRAGTRLSGPGGTRSRSRPQEHRIHGRGVDPRRSAASTSPWTTSTGRSSSAGQGAGRRAAPAALMPPMPLHAKVQRGGAARFARTGSGIRPRSRSSSGARRGRGWTGRSTDAALSLDGSYLFVQGPPGSGKTWSGARVALALMQARPARRHDGPEPQGDPQVPRRPRGGGGRGGLRVPRPEEGRAGRATTRAASSRAPNSNDAMLDPELQLVAGTSWLFAREELDQHVDTLFVDEGGQFALADAIAVGTAARNLVLLGDPNQLPQVSQGSHPPGAEASVLGHLLGTTRRCRPTAGSSSSRRGGCGRR